MKIYYLGKINTNTTAKHSEMLWSVIITLSGASHNGSLFFIYTYIVDWLNYSLKTYVFKKFNKTFHCLLILH